MAEHGFLRCIISRFSTAINFWSTGLIFQSYTRFGGIDHSSNKGKAVTLAVKAWQINIPKTK